MQLTEKYRPKSWTEVVGQDKAVTVCRSAIARNAVGGRAFWISGKSGTGKTTIARLLAAEMADEFGTIEIDAGRLTVARLEEIRGEMAYRCIGERGGRCYIFNEAHGLRKNEIRNLLVLLESIPSYCTIIFTTTLDGQAKLFDDYDDASPLLSRCLILSMAQRDVTPAYARRLMEIGTAEGLIGPDVGEKDIVKLLQTHRNNVRAALQEIESGAFLA